jgi:anion-transporting  ArsA/GET3 family ATPase
MVLPAAGLDMSILPDQGIMESTILIRAWAHVFQQRLIIVSGKGGVGKTAIASALVTFDTQLDTHPLLGVPIGYEPTEAAPGLSVLRVDGLSAIQEYVRRKVPFSRVYEGFFRSRMFRDFAEASPGFEELMCLGKLYDLVSESAFERVIFDAPSTGHLKMLIDVPAATLDVVRVGPLNHNARKIQDLLFDPERTRMVLVTLAEELAVSEALELVEFLRERRMRVGPIVVNQTVPSRFSAEELARMRGLTERSQMLDAAIAVATAEHLQAVDQHEALQALDRVRASVWSVPRIVDTAPDLLLHQLTDTLELERRGG